MTTTEIKNELLKLTQEFKEVMNNYVEINNRYNSSVISKIDTTIRDSIEKQLIKAKKEDPSFLTLENELNSLKIQKDSLSKQISVLKALLFIDETGIDANQEYLED